MKTNYFKKISFIILMFCFVSYPVFATDYYLDAVNGNDGNDGSTLGNAFQTWTKVSSVIADGDVVYLSGTITSGATFTTGKSFTLKGINNATIDVNFAGRCMQISDGNVTLEDITFTRGFRSGNGGGVAIDNPGGNANVINIINCSFTNNFATQSSAIDVNAVGATSELYISGCTFTNNNTATTADNPNLTVAPKQTVQIRENGGIAEATIENSVFENNMGSDCVILNAGTKLNLINCQIQNNSTQGLYSSKTIGSELYIHGCLFKGNANAITTNVVYSGGGMTASNQLVYIEGSAFVKNSTVGNTSGGGGIRFNEMDGSKFTMINSTVAQNSTQNGRGAGIHIEGTQTTATEISFINTTLVDNFSARNNNDASGLSIYDGGTFFAQIKIYNSIFENNTTNSGATPNMRDIDLRSGKNASLTAGEQGHFSVRNSFVQFVYGDNSTGTSIFEAGDIVDSNVGGRGWTSLGIGSNFVAPASGLDSFDDTNNVYPLASSSSLAYNFGDASLLAAVGYHTDQLKQYRSFTNGKCHAGAVELVSGDAVSGSYYVWTGAAGDTQWTTAANWNPEGIPDAASKVYIPNDVSNYPSMTAANSAGEIHFAPGAQLGAQNNLTVGKVFVQYDLSERNRWQMLSVPLAEVYPADFTFGNYPPVYVNSFTANYAAPSSVATGNWVTLRSSQTPFTFGDGFVLWLESDDYSPIPADNDSKGLKKAGNILELPYFQHQAADSPDQQDKELYDAIHPAHTYNGSYNGMPDGSQQSAFFKPTFNTTTNVYDFGSEYSVSRSADAYRLAGSGDIDKTPEFPDGSNFALIGNPYMGVLDFGAFHEYGTNANVIKNACYVWIKDGYAGYCPDPVDEAFGVSVPASVQYIAPLQGFIVEKTDSYTDGSPLVFNLSLSSVNAHNDATLRSSASKENLLKIVARNPEAEVAAIVAQREGGQNELGNMDIRKLSNGISNVPDIYTLKPSEGNVVGTAVNIVNSDDQLIPVGLSTSYEGDITLSFSGMDNYDATATLTFVDGEQEFDITGLSSFDHTVNYTPILNAGAPVACENRFFIRISKTITGISETPVAKVNVYESNSQLQIVSGASNPIEEVTVYNMQGAEVFKAAAIHAGTYTVVRNFPAGAYVVKVVSEKNVDNMKVLMR